MGMGIDASQWRQLTSIQKNTPRVQKSGQQLPSPAAFWMLSEEWLTISDLCVFSARKELDSE